MIFAISHLRPRNGSSKFSQDSNHAPLGKKELFNVMQRNPQVSTYIQVFELRESMELIRILLLNPTDGFTNFKPLEYVPTFSSTAAQITCVLELDIPYDENGARLSRPPALQASRSGCG